MEWWKCLHKDDYPPDSPEHKAGEEACHRIYVGYVLFPRLQLSLIHI